MSLFPNTSMTGFHLYFCHFCCFTTWSTMLSARSPHRRRCRRIILRSVSQALLSIEYSRFSGRPSTLPVGNCTFTYLTCPSLQVIILIIFLSFQYPLGTLSLIKTTSPTFVDTNDNILPSFNLCCVLSRKLVR